MQETHINPQMDTDELSNEAYTAVLIEAERFHHNLTIHFGVLAGDCVSMNARHCKTSTPNCEA